jgi:hypothetical protein
MLPNRDEVIKALQNTHLFRSLDDAQLGQVVDSLEIGDLNGGQVLFRQGDAAGHFYIVMSGSVKLTQKRRNTDVLVANLVEGDYFGEEALGRNGRRPVTVTALEATRLLRLEADKLAALYKTMPTLRQNIRIAQTTHQLLQHNLLPWLNPEEIVYLMARKHSYFMWESLSAPLFGGVVSLVLMGLFYFDFIPGTITPVLLTGAVYLFCLGWGVWKYIDWSNDYSIVTNQRVVWLERVAGIYDSRQEAPLTTLLSVGMRSDQVGRWVGYGDVLVRTYTGTMVLPGVADAAQVASLVEDYWTRSRVLSRKNEAQTIGKTIRTRLGLESGELPPNGQDGGAKTYHAVHAEVKPGPIQAFFANFFQVRFEQGDTVTYRKHWFVLLRSTWKPIFWLIVLMLIEAARLANWFTLLSSQVTLALCGAAGLGIVAWFMYDYVDWRNDIYQVTPDQIVDVEKRPLGKEERRAAPLENILSIEYQRLGILGLLLNFGTVTINIGSAHFSFEYVYNPSQVQQDIFRRMNQRIQARKQADADAERERISDWITIYHQSLHPGETGQNPPAEANPQ